MSPKKWIILGILAAGAITYIYTAGRTTSVRPLSETETTSEFANYQKKNLRIGENTFTVYVADTTELRELGLSGTSGLPSDSGMLFVFPQAGKYPFWMKDMRYPLDMVWIDDAGKVVDITKDAKPESYPTTFAPKESARWVLELTAGETEKKNIQIGEYVVLSD